MEKLVIIGGGGHARVIASVVAMKQDYEIAGYTDMQAGEMGRVSYLGDDSMLTDLFRNQGVKHAVLGIGSLGDTRKRRRLFARLREIGFSTPPVVAASAVIHPDVRLGEGTVVFDGVVVNPNCRVGACVILNTNATVEHDCEIGDFAHISPGVNLGGNVVIGGSCHIGIGSTVIQGLKIGGDCFIAAGSVVVRDCISGGRYKGVPARLDSKTNA